MEHHFERAAALILGAIDIRPTDEGYPPPFRDTPDRFATALHEMLAGHFEPPPELTTFEYRGPPQLITSYDNQAYCLCPHHLLAVELTCSVGYVTHGEPSLIIGLSKLPRLIRWSTSRLTTQEELSADIMKRVVDATNSEDVFVHIRGSHSCMRARGIKTRGTVDSLLAVHPASVWMTSFLAGLKKNGV